MNNSPNKIGNIWLTWIAVVVAGLGYFVDVFDMWLFANFRVISLQAMGLTGDELTNSGIYIMNFQQAGFLTGGVIWGVMGDKRGRVSVMFGSILIYSLATLLCAYVSSVDQYALLRFVAGFGLAGEIGAGITLISEILPKNQRGYGTTFVTALGVAGAIFAAMAGKYMDWQHAYILGGVMGLALLVLRAIVHESGMYHSMNSEDGIKKGSLKLLFGDISRALRFVYCVFVGIPIYLVFGLIISFAPEIAVAIGIEESLSVPDVMLYGSIGITVGDLFSGLLSQFMKSRKKPMVLFLGIAVVLTSLLTQGFFKTAAGYMVVGGILGVCTGYWACLITASAEQFGTNLRATATTMVPNLVRASAIGINMGFVWVKDYTNAANSAFAMTLISFGLALFGLWKLKETYGRDLNFVERDNRATHPEVLVEA